MKITEIKGREPFQIEGISDIWQIGAPMVNEHLDNAPGYWCINQDNQGVWFANEVNVELVTDDIQGEARVETSAGVDKTPTQITLEQSYEQYINDPSPELNKRIKKMAENWAMEKLAEMKATPGYQEQEKKIWHDMLLGKPAEYKIDYNQIAQETSWVSTVDKMKSLQEYNNLHMEYMNQQALILQWYKETQDQKFKEFFSIEVKRVGE